MLEYSNAFHIAVDANDEEVVVSFRQNLPPFSDSDGPEASVKEAVPKSEPVASIVMSSSTAAALAKGIQEMLDSVEDQDNPEQSTK